MLYDKKGHAPDWIRPLVFLIIFGVIILSGRYFNLADNLHYILESIDALGSYGVAIFIGLYILGSVLFVPGSILTMSSGFIFGFWKGLLIGTLSCLLGVTAAFLVGRYFARSWISRRIEGHSKIEAIDEAIGKEGWRIVWLFRLSPLFPINILNYLFGITKVTLRQYMFASFLGMLPLVFLYVYIGSLASNIATLGTDSFFESKGTWQWLFYVAGLLLTVAAVVYVTHLAKRTLKKNITSKSLTTDYTD